MKGFQVQEFDPTENLRNGLKLVLVVKDNQVERFMEDDDATTPAKNLLDTHQRMVRVGGRRHDTCRRGCLGK